MGRQRLINSNLLRLSWRHNSCHRPPTLLPSPSSIRLLSSLLLETLQTSQTFPTRPTRPRSRQLPCIACSASGVGIWRRRSSVGEVQSVVVPGINSIKVTSLVNTSQALIIYGLSIRVFFIKKKPIHSKNNSKNLTPLTNEVMIKMSIYRILSGFFTFMSRFLKYKPIELFLPDVRFRTGLNKESTAPIQKHDNQELKRKKNHLMFNKRVTIFK